MKKKIVLLAIILIVALLGVIIVSHSVFTTKKYDSKKTITNLILKATEYHNIYAKETSNNKLDNSQEIQEIYIKDRIKVTTNSTKNNLNYENFNTQKQILLDFNEKTMFFSTLPENELCIVNSWFYNMFLTAKDYTFEGREKIDNNNYLICTLRLSDIASYKFWINEDTGLIMQVEYYSNNTNELTINYEYSFDIVTDKNIIQPTKEFYPNFEIYSDK